MSVKLKYLCLTHRKLLDQACLWITAGRKKLTQPKWLPTAVFLRGELHGQRSLAGYSPWGCKESDTTEHLTHTHTHRRWLEPGNFQLYSPSEYKRSLNSNSDKRVLWDRSLPSPGSAGFLNKVAVPCPNTHLSIYWLAVQTGKDEKWDGWIASPTQ